MSPYHGIASVLPELVRDIQSAQAAMLEIEFIDTVMHMTVTGNMRVPICNW